MPHIKSDLVELLVAIGKQELGQTKLEIDARTAATVMLAFFQGEAIRINMRRGRQLQDWKM